MWQTLVADFFAKCVDNGCRIVYLKDMEATHIHRINRNLLKLESETADTITFRVVDSWYDPAGGLVTVPRVVAAVTVDEWIN